MQIIRPDINIDFVGKNRVAVIISILFLLAGIVSLVVRGGPEYGVDFAGGTLIQVQFTEPTEAADIREALQRLPLGSLTVQQFGDEPNEFLIRAQETSSEQQQISHQVRNSLAERFGEGQVEIRRAESVGSQVGEELRGKGLLALLYAMAGTLIYISWRFEFRFAVGAVVALVHDVLITLGFFSFFGKELDLTIIAAFLTIIGYSLNDTIIIYDRVRENLGRNPSEGFAAIVNRSLNETLSRTILTSGTTLLVVVALFLFGGPVINNFAFALLVGIIVGTYSTIFVASALVLYWEEKHPRQVPENLPPADI
ncbi:MAG: protein translocase subunit SecF [Desulfuromonadales bacterium]|nr:protein translocase subunit SecF [Desulfuromonadales bacterium]